MEPTSANNDSALPEILGSLQIPSSLAGTSTSLHLISHAELSSWPRFAAEFGRDLPQLQGTLKYPEKEKEQTLEHFERSVRDVKTMGIKGLGVRYLGGILTKAHPSKFRSLSAYLAYCGLKGSVRRSGRYSRHVLSLYHQLSSSAIMHKDKESYPLYRKVKADLSKHFPGYPKYKVDGMARNRISTFLAKRLYASFKAVF